MIENIRPAGRKPPVRVSAPQMAQLIRPPTMEPTIPSSIVANQLMASRPGMIRRASAPAINPIISHQMKLSMLVSPYLNKAFAREGQRGKIQLKLDGAFISLLRADF